MLFLSLLVYILIWPLYIMFIEPIIGLDSFFIIIFVPFIVFGLSFIISILSVYICHMFNPEFKRAIRNTLRIPGAKWLALATAVTAVLSLVALTVHDGLSYAIFGFFIPIITVSILNALNIDWIPQMLTDEAIAPKLVTLPRIAPREIERDILKTFSWKFKEQVYELSLIIRKSVYDHYKSKARVPAVEWASEYVARGICGEIRALAFKLMQTGKPYGTYEEVSFVLSFVQQALKYEQDEGEYPRYPVESLVDGIGDCEDYSILGASILKLMGYEVALLLLPGHAALGVAGAEDIPGVSVEYQDNKYFYCEMTAAGWQIGELPEDHKNEKIDACPIPGVIMEISDSREAAVG